MMKNIQRLLISIVIALFVAGATYLVAQAHAHNDTANTPRQADQQADCSACHSKFTDALSTGAHGHSMSDTKFQQMWMDQGKPGACLVCHATGYDPATGSVLKDSVSCEDCHNPIPPNHSSNPASNPVPVDRTNNLCARCHSDPRFGLAQFQTSTHYQVGMTCTVCHDPHTAAIKTVPDTSDKGPSALCINCHKEVAMNFPYSVHAQSGISCVDCHLLHPESQTSADVHAMPDHSFKASLATCTTCHSDQMHTNAATAVSTPGAATPQLEPTTTLTPTVADKPAPVSPAGFSGLAGLLGLAGGMVLQPWLEKAYHQVNGRKGGKNEPKKD
jgi:predicted CXXCH cytochrome family protein